MACLMCKGKAVQSLSEEWMIFDRYYGSEIRRQSFLPLFSQYTCTDERFMLDGSLRRETDANYFAFPSLS